MMKLLERDRPARIATAEAASADLLACAEAPKDGRASLIAVLAQRFPHQMPVRQSQLRSRGAPQTPVPIAHVAHAATMPSDSDPRSAPTRALQPKRAPIALLVALTIVVAAGSF